MSGQLNNRTASSSERVCASSKARLSKRVPARYRSRFCSQFKRYTLPLVVVACLLMGSALPHSSSFVRRVAAQSDAARAREDAYRVNNLGVALLEQFKPKEAAEQFRRALRLDPRLALARINLAVALFNVPDVDAA